MDTLKGQLLLSGGGLFDPNFRQTVVLIGEHNADGAVGVVLNRALDVSVDRAVPSLAGLAGPAAPLFQGGPVAPDEVILLAAVSDPGLLDLPIFGSVGFLTGDVPSEVRPFLLKARIFAGHAGWGAGQLEAEMKAGAWIVEEATEDDVFTRAPDTLWPRILKRKGPPYAALANIPFDPSMN